MAINYDQLSQQFPSLSTGLIASIAKETGIDVNDPKAMAGIKGTRTYQERMQRVANEGPGALTNMFSGSTQSDELSGGVTRQENRIHDRRVNALNQTFQNPSDVTVASDPNASGVQELGSLVTATNRGFNETQRAIGLATSLSSEATARLSRLGTMNREAKINQELRVKQPTKDIDERMLQIRLESFQAEAVMRERLTGLPMNLRQHALSALYDRYNSELSDLKDVREARLNSFKNQVNANFDSEQERIQSLKDERDAYNDMISSLERRGASQLSIANFRRNSLISEKNLTKATKGGGVTDEVQQLADAYMASHTKADKAEALAYARNALREMKSRREGVQSIIGDGTGLQTIQSSPTANLGTEQQGFQTLLQQASGGTPGGTSLSDIKFGQ